MEQRFQQKRSLDPLKPNSLSTDEHSIFENFEGGLKTRLQDVGLNQAQLGSLIDNKERLKGKGLGTSHNFTKLRSQNSPKKYQLQRRLSSHVLDPISQELVLECVLDCFAPKTQA